MYRQIFATLIGDCLAVAARRARHLGNGEKAPGQYAIIRMFDRLTLQEGLKFTNQMVPNGSTAGSATIFSSRSLRTVFCSDSIPFRGGAKSEDICLLFKIKGYLCSVVGNRPRETLQNGAVFRWSNRGRQLLLPKSNSKIHSYLNA